MAPTRRELLLGALALGCTSPSAPRVRYLEVPVAAVPAQGGHEVSFNDTPVEVRRTPDGGFRAFALICTHMGCRVAWSEREAAYVCPCHGGRFAADGRPIKGPPLKPLSLVPVKRDGEKLILG